MEKITDNLPEFFYDLIGIFIPGFYLYFCFSLIFSQESISALLKISFLNETVATIFIIYIIGHIIYSFGTLFVAKLFNYLGGNPTYILLGIPQLPRQELFNRKFLREIIDQNNHYYRDNVQKFIREMTGDSKFELSDFPSIDIGYEFCRNYIMEKTVRRAAAIRKEQAYGEMSRGIVLVTFISILTIIIREVFYSEPNNFGYIFLFYLASFICFAYRYGQARHINPVFIYSTFCSLANEKQNERKNESDNGKKEN